MGRATKLTKTAKRVIVEAISAGTTQKDAVLAAGIDITSYHRWLNRGEEETEGIYREFRQAVLRAKNLAQFKYEDVILKAANGEFDPIIEKKIVDKDGKKEITITERHVLPDWRAAAFWLERKIPDVYGRKDNVKVDLGWRDELEKKGVDPDAAIDQLAATLRPILVERGDEGGTDETGDSEG